MCTKVGAENFSVASAADYLVAEGCSGSGLSVCLYVCLSVYACMVLHPSARTYFSAIVRTFVAAAAAAAGAADSIWNLNISV